MFRFANNSYLMLLWIIPIMVILFIIMRYIRKKQLEQLCELPLQQRMMAEISILRPYFKFVLLVLALTSIIFMLARPQFGLKTREVKREGIEMVIALDVSNSMMAEDIQPNRLERAKLALSKMLDKLESDRVGLVVFAGKAYVQVPITTDYSAIKMMLASISTNIVPTQGTAMGDAINLSMQLFNFENSLEKVIVVITDGENHEDDPIEAAKLAMEKKVRVHTIGLGSIMGTPIPFNGPYGQKVFLKDNEGNVVVSRLDEDILKSTAKAGSGIYVSGNSAGMGLKAVMDEINKMEKKEVDAKIFSDYEDQFQWFAFLTLLILLIEIIVIEKKPNWVSKLRLFESENTKESKK